jgi:hypothetical protein
MPSAVRIERVAAMHADLELGLGLGSHAGQGTRYGRESVLIFESTARQSTSCRTDGVQFKVTAFVRRELVIFGN